MPEHKSRFANKLLHWVGEEARLAAFLRSTDHLVPNAIAVSNHGFFLTRAAQWLTLASVQWRLERTVNEITYSLGRYLQESLYGLDHGAILSPALVHSLYFTALTLGRIGLAQFLAVLPDPVWSLPSPPHAHRILVEARVSFALLRGDEAFAERLLETLEGLSFGRHLTELVTRDQARSRMVYPILMAVRNRNSTDFDHNWFKFVDNLHPFQGSIGIDISASIAALGFIRLAQIRGMSVNVGNSELSLALFDAVQK